MISPSMEDAQKGLATGQSSSAAEAMPKGAGTQALLPGYLARTSPCPGRSSLLLYPVYLGTDT